MRIGDSRSLSYRRVAAHRRIRKLQAISRYCERLDKLVEQAEACGHGTKSRRNLMARADKVRESLRKIDH